MPNETKFTQRNQAAGTQTGSWKGRPWDNPILPKSDKGVKKEQPASSDTNQYYTGKEGAGTPATKEEYMKAKGPKHYYTKASDKYIRNK